MSVIFSERGVYSTTLQLDGKMLVRALLWPPMQCVFCGGMRAIVLYRNNQWRCPDCDTREQQGEKLERKVA